MLMIFSARVQRPPTITGLTRHLIWLNSSLDSQELRRKPVKRLSERKYGKARLATGTSLLTVVFALNRLRRRAVNDIKVGIM